MMSNNSRLPIDLESDVVVEFAGKSGQGWTGPTEHPRILIPTALRMRPRCSNRPDISAHHRAAGVRLPAHGFRRRLGGDPSAPTPAARLALVVTGSDVRDACVALAVAAGADRPDPFRRTPSRTTVIGFAASALLPARAGEVLRPYLLARRERLNAAAAFATIMLERLLDLATVLLLFSGLRLHRWARRDVGRPAAACPGEARRRRWRRPRRWRARLCCSCWRAIRSGSAGRRCGSSGCCRPGSRALVASLVETFAQGLAVMRDPARLVDRAGAVVSDVDVDRRRDLADVAGISYYVSLRGFVPRDDDAGGRCRGADARRDRRLSPRLPVRGDDVFRVPTPTVRSGAAIVLHAISFVPVTLLGARVHGARRADARRRAAHGGRSRRTIRSGASRGVDALPADGLEKGAP